MKTEKELNQEITRLMAEFHEKVESLTRSQSKDLSDRIVALKKGLSDLISNGAINCPACDVAPHGMLKTSEIKKLGAVEKPAIYEVGCIICENRMRGNTPKEAVDNWNSLYEPI